MRLRTVRFLSKKLSNVVIVLTVLFFLALLVRVYNLGSLPFAFHEDEMSNAYIGRFILLTGRDVYGSFLPLLYVDKFGDYPPSIPMYIAGAGTFLFGVNEFGARASTALIGALTIFPFYGISYILFRKKSALSYTSALLLAIAPWHIVFSRSSAEGILGLFAYSCGLYFLLAFLTRHNKKHAVYAGLFFLSTYFLYPSYRLFVPLSLVPLPFIYYRVARIRLWLLGLISIFTVVTLLVASTVWGRGRFEQTSLVHSATTKESIEATLTALNFDLGDGNQRRARIFNNKAIAYAREYVYQYVQYFSLERLFLTGGQPFRYYPLAYQGLFYITFLPLIGIGFFALSRKIKTPEVLYIVLLTALVPVPAALTVDFTPHFHRVMPFLIPFTLAGAYGIGVLHRIRWRRFSGTLAVALLVSIEVVYFYHHYVWHSRSFEPLYRNDMYREVVQEVAQRRGDYESVFMMGEEKLPMYYLYFTNNFDPGLTGSFSNNMQIPGVDNIQFINNWCLTGEIEYGNLPEKTLIVENGDCQFPVEFEKIHEIRRSNSTRAFHFLVPKKSI